MDQRTSSGAAKIGGGGGGGAGEPLMAAMAIPDSVPAPSGGTATASVEGTGYRWEDRFFDDTDGIIAVFDFDYEKIENFQWDMTKCSLLCPLTCPFTCLIPSICCLPCFAKANIEWAARAQHVAVHRDGIKFVRDKRKAWCGLQCSDQGKNSKTVPFDKLTDCDVQEPAGMACCCFIPNVLSEVTVDTASSGGTNEHGVTQHELSLKGLRDPHAFKKCVWDCKRAAVNMAGTGIGSIAPAADMSGRNEEQIGLLQEIRDELHAQTRLLEAQAAVAKSGPDTSLVGSTA